MPYCPDCGREVAPTDRYCMDCGARLPALPGGPGDGRQSTDPAGSTGADDGADTGGEGTDGGNETGAALRGEDDRGAGNEFAWTDDGPGEEFEWPDDEQGDGCPGTTAGPAEGDDEHVGEHVGEYDDQHASGFGDEHAGEYDDQHASGFGDEHAGEYDDEYMAPPGEWSPPSVDDVPTPARLGLVGTLGWAGRTVAGRPGLLGPFLLSGILFAGASVAAFGTAFPPSPSSLPPSPASVVLGALGLAAGVPAVAAAALSAEDAVVGHDRGVLAVLAAVRPRLARFLAAAAAATVLVFAGYVLFVLPGVVLGVAVSFAGHAALVDGTGPVESVERSARVAVLRPRTVAPLGAAVPVLVALLAVPVAGGLVAALVAPLVVVAMGRTYLEERVAVSRGELAAGGPPG